MAARQEAEIRSQSWELVPGTPTGYTDIPGGGSTANPNGGLMKSF